MIPLEKSPIARGERSIAIGIEFHGRKSKMNKTPELDKITGAISLSNLATGQVRELQQLLKLYGIDVDVDGIMGEQTKIAFATFKIREGQALLSEIGEGSIGLLKQRVSLKNKSADSLSNFALHLKPIYSHDKRKMIVSFPEGFVQEALGKEDLHNLAGEFGLPVPCVQAVMSVESGNSGFLLQEPSPTRPKILFEGHWFYKLSSQPVSKSRPDLSYPQWTTKYYRGGSFEWSRLIDAMAFDPIPALKSASWGLGQIMGFNYASCGYNSVEDFVIDMHKSEYHQAKAMFNFIKQNGLLGKLRGKNWAGFAKGYNG